MAKQEHVHPIINRQTHEEFLLRVVEDPADDGNKQRAQAECWPNQNAKPAPHGCPHCFASGGELKQCKIATELLQQNILQNGRVNLAFCKMLQPIR